MKEIWKDIFEFEGAYQISNLGRVRSLQRHIKRKKDPTRREHLRKIPERILIPSTTRKGYFRVKLCLEGDSSCFSVHQLVARHFLINPGMLKQVNHIDGNKQNNSVDNLEWCDNSKNQLHAYSTGLHSVNNAKPVVGTDKNGATVFFNSCAEASRELSIKGNSISSVCSGKNKYRHTAGGYAWRYATKDEIIKYSKK